ncbi:MAG: hypothetical protein AABN95_24760 [Acidobacteriota bacterium]
MKSLRERGIYVAPDGQSFVASKSRRTTSNGEHILSRIGSELYCYLFSRYQWALHGEPDFEVSRSGRILPLKQTNGLRADELIDTGATAGAH